MWSIPLVEVEAVTRRSILGLDLPLRFTQANVTNLPPRYEHSRLDRAHALLVRQGGRLRSAAASYGHGETDTEHPGEGPPLHPSICFDFSVSPGASPRL